MGSLVVKTTGDITRRYKTRNRLERYLEQITMREQPKSMQTTFEAVALNGYGV